MKANSTQKPQISPNRNSGFDEILQTMKTHFPSLSSSQIHEIIAYILTDIVASMEKTHRVEIRKFGVFSTKLRRPKKIKIPTQQSSITLSYRQVPFFKPARALKDKINPPSKGPLL